MFQGTNPKTERSGDGVDGLLLRFHVNVKIVLGWRNMVLSLSTRQDSSRDGKLLPVTPLRRSIVLSLSTLSGGVFIVVVVVKRVIDTFFVL